MINIETVSKYFSENAKCSNPRINTTNHHFLFSPCALYLTEPLIPPPPSHPVPSHLTSPSLLRLQTELCSPSVSAAVVTTATNPAISRNPMNYLGWRPTGNTRIIPIPSTRIQALVHIRDRGRGRAGRAMRLILWQPQLLCLQLVERE